MKYPKLKLNKLDHKEFASKFESWILCANFEAGGEPKFQRSTSKIKNIDNIIEKYKKRGVLK